MALRVGDELRAIQSRSGYWKGVSSPKPSSDVTAEIVVWLDAIRQSAED
jgi:hypothetical protein